MIGRLIKRVARWVTVTRVLRLSAALTLVALALMVWSVLQPTPLPILLAMSLGQALGTTAFAMYGFAIWIDLRRTRRARRESSMRLPPLGREDVP